MGQSCWNFGNSFNMLLITYVGFNFKNLCSFKYTKITLMQLL